MATTLTTNLKLRISDDLTSDATYNLNKIDTLGLTNNVDSTGNLRIKAFSDIQLQPNSADVGGSGVGGTITLGEIGNNITLVDIRSAETKLTGGPLSIANSVAKISLAASDSMITDFSLTLPIEDGTASQAIITDGAGVLSWQSFVPAAVLTPDTVVVASTAEEIVSSTVTTTELGYLTGASSNIQAQIDLLGGANQAVATWIPADGLSKTITHNFGSRNILIQVLDSSDNYANIDVEITRPTDNTAVLTASELPSASWSVLLVEIS